MSTHRLRSFCLTLLALLLTVPSSWAWGHGRFGSRIVIGIGPWWPGWYPDYAYERYEPGDSPEYAVAPLSLTSDAYAPEVPLSSTQASGTDLSTLNRQISRARDHVNFQFEDGDISKGERDEALQRLNEIANQARSGSGATVGSIAPDSANDLLRQIRDIDPEIHPNRIGGDVVRVQPRTVTSTPTGAHRDLNAVNDLLLELRALLDQKVKDGEITKAQSDAEKNVLQRIDRDAHSQSGPIDAQRADVFIQELHQAYYTINHNFVSE